MKEKYFKTIVSYSFLLLLEILISSCGNNINNNVCVNASPASKCTNNPDNNSTQNSNQPEIPREPSPDKDSSSNQQSNQSKIFSSRHYQNSDHQVFLSSHNGGFRYEAQRKNSTESPVVVSCSSHRQDEKILLDCINGNVTYKVTIDLLQQNSIVVQVYEDGKAYSPLVLNAV
jgi:hypothetical protein